MRFLSLRLLVSILIAIQLVSCAAIQPRPNTGYDARLNGVWQGKIAIDNAREEALECRLNIADDKASVWIAMQGQWREAKSGTFHLNAHKSNAVIFSNDSGTDTDGAWVESWVFVVTLSDNDELLVEWSRVVNNLDMPKSVKGSKFTVHGSGTVRRLYQD